MNLLLKDGFSESKAAFDEALPRDDGNFLFLRESTIFCRKRQEEVHDF